MINTQILNIWIYIVNIVISSKAKHLREIWISEKFKTRSGGLKSLLSREVSPFSKVLFLDLTVNRLISNQIPKKFCSSANYIFFIMKWLDHYRALASLYEGSSFLSLSLLSTESLQIIRINTFSESLLILIKCLKNVSRICRNEIKLIKNQLNTFQFV